MRTKESGWRNFVFAPFIVVILATLLVVYSMGFVAGFAKGWWHHFTSGEDQNHGT